jgi:hypothetical protein
MRFRDLSIHAANKAEFLGKLDARTFNRSCWHVQEIFLSFLPRDYVLDGTAKTNVVCGSNDEDDKYQILMNVNVYYVEDFDFESYENACEKNRELIILETLKSALLDIANRCDANPQPIIDALKKVIEFDFKVSIETRLSRSTQSRKLRFKVIKDIRNGGEDWYIDVCTKKEELLERVIIQEDTNALAGLYDFKKSRWEGDDFVILDHVDNESFRLNSRKIQDTYAGT